MGLRRGILHLSTCLPLRSSAYRDCPLIFLASTLSSLCICLLRVLFWVQLCQKLLHCLQLGAGLWRQQRLLCARQSLDPELSLQLSSSCAFWVQLCRNLPHCLQLRGWLWGRWVPLWARQCLYSRPLSWLPNLQFAVVELESSGWKRVISESLSGCFLNLHLLHLLPEIRPYSF